MILGSDPLGIMVMSYILHTFGDADIFRQYRYLILNPDKLNVTGIFHQINELNDMLINSIIEFSVTLSYNENKSVVHKNNQIIPVFLKRILCLTKSIKVTIN
jgi:hypothetical protein